MDAVATQSKTALAMERFLAEVVQIPGVLRVVVTGGDLPEEQLVTVYVPSLRSETAREVIRLHMSLYREIAGSRLEVHVDGISELRITEDLIDRRIPPGARVVK